MENSPARLRPRSLILFESFRAAYAAAVSWWTVVLIVAFYVRTPGKSRAGTLFAHKVAPVTFAMGFGLFFIGAGWFMLSKRAEASTAIRWSIYIAFAVMVLALFLTLDT